MLLVRLTARLLRAAPGAGKRPGRWAAAGPWTQRPAGSPAPPVTAVLCPALRAPPAPPCPAARAFYSAQPTGGRGAVALPGSGVHSALEDMLVPRKMSVSPLESWLAARRRLPPPDAGDPAPPPCGPPPGPAARALRCRNVLKIRRRKMNRHKYRKLVRRTRFLRRKVREGRLRRKQDRFERDLRRLWRKAGLKDAPAGWQAPRIYVKGK